MQRPGRIQREEGVIEPHSHKEGLFMWDLSMLALVCVNGFFLCLCQDFDNLGICVRIFTISFQTPMLFQCFTNFIPVILFQDIETYVSQCQCCEDKEDEEPSALEALGVISIHCRLLIQF